MINASSITWDKLKTKQIRYDDTRTIRLELLVTYMNENMVTRSKKDILIDILDLCGIKTNSDTVPNVATAITFSRDELGNLQFHLNNQHTNIECSCGVACGAVYFKPKESADDGVESCKIEDYKFTLGGSGSTYSLGYIAICMDKYSAYHNMQMNIDPLKLAQNCVLREISNIPNNTESSTNKTSFLAWTSLGKYYITNKQLQYFSVPTIAGEVQWGNESDDQGGWFIFDEKQDFGLAKQSEPKNFALANFTEIPDQIIFENFSNSTPPEITWVDDKTIKINESSFYIGEKGKVMVIKRGPAQTHTVSHELMECYFSSSWGLMKKNRTIFSHITTEWKSQNGPVPPSRPDSKKVHVSLSSFSLQQGQLARNQTSLSAIKYSTINNHRLLTNISATQEIDNDLSLPLRSSTLRPDGYVPTDPTFYVFVGQTATATSTGGMNGGGSSKSYASSYLRLKIQVTNLPVIKNQETWLVGSVGELHSDGHHVNDEVSYEGDYEHYLYNIWDLNLNPGLLDKDIDIYGAKTDTIKYRTWLNTAYMYFPKNSSTQYVFQETKGLDDYTSSVYCGLGFYNKSDDFAYCIYITYNE